MYKVLIKKCPNARNNGKCRNKFQDKQYGKNKRLFNKMKDDNKWRCTVCGQEVSA